MLNGGKPELSAELFLISIDASRRLVYAPLRQAAFVANDQMVNILADLKEGVFDPSSDPDGAILEFLRRLEIVDGGPEELPLTTFSGDPEPTAVTLFLTTACNLRCTYCYASAGDSPARFMSLDVAKRGIDFVASNAARKGVPGFDVTFHGGGEPTVNWSILTEAVVYAKQVAFNRKLGLKAIVATNGFLTDDQTDWVIANMQGASVSFDGLPEIHDENRPAVRGQNSSARVMRTIRRFDDAGLQYGLRVTVTGPQIPRLAESIEFICSNFKVHDIQVEPAYQLGRWKNAPSSETAEFIQAFRNAREIAERYGRTLMFSAARLGILTNHFCGVTQDSFCLSPDGGVSGCFEVFSEDHPMSKTFFYGVSGSKGAFEFDLPVLNNLRASGVEHREFCRGCFAKWTCGGDCLHKGLTVSTTGQFEGSDRCHITRELTKDQILDRIAASGGLFWHEARSVRSRAAGWRAESAPGVKEVLV